LFQPFSQADSSTTRKYGGTGLGLTITKDLIEPLDGEIGVESVPNEGPIFWFTMIAEKGDPAKARQNIADDEPLEIPGSQNDRTLHILVAEDNDINKQIITGMLGPLSGHVDMVDNGLQAVAAVARSRYDVVLMDAHMPEMDGTTATRKIRSLPKPVSDVPIIALTADAMRGNRRKFLDAGMNDYVVKPIDQRELFRAISRCIDVSVRAPETKVQSSDPDTVQHLNLETTKEMDNLIGNLDEILDGTER